MVVVFEEKRWTTTSVRMKLSSQPPRSFLPRLGETSHRVSIPGGQLNPLSIRRRTTLHKGIQHFCAVD